MMLRRIWNEAVQHLQHTFIYHKTGNNEYISHYSIYALSDFPPPPLKLKDKDIQNCNFTIFFFLYGCETWSLKQREVDKLRVFENRVLGRIFGPKREEVVGDWIRSHNEELCD